MPLVFVSYSNQDRDIAFRLVDRLRAAAPEGLAIEIDEPIDAASDTIGADAYRLPFVGKRLRNANAVIAVLTRSYAESDPCWLEMSAAKMMEKVVPINLDPGLSPAGLSSMVAQKNIIAIAPGWFSKEPGEVEAAETAKFERFVRDLKIESEKHSPFSAWAPAEPKDVRRMTAALAEALQPRPFRRTGLIWSPGSIAQPEKKRFFAAIESMAIATGDSPWDLARRRALKAMAAEPGEARVRAEALMGLIGELTAPSDGSAPVIAQEPWEFIGDFALPIDRDISRFAYTRAGKIPNELRKLFQVLRPGRSKRRAIFTLGALLGGAVGVALTYGGSVLFGQPGPKTATGPAPEPTDASSPQFATPSPQPSHDPLVVVQSAPEPMVAPPAAPAEIVQAPASSTFVVNVRGLEATVQAELARRQMNDVSWREVYSQVISLNINALCSPGRWKVADEVGRKPLDVIRAETQLSWPTETDFETVPRLQECPIVYAAPT